MKKLLNIFNKTEIRNSTPAIYDYSGRKKIVVFIPLGNADKLSFDLAAAGAGVIGNYTLCSYRMKGLGTFIPEKRSNPYTGRKGKISFKEEIRLEMEFAEEDTDSVVEALLQNHPYEEPAYEIYDFKKRNINPSGYLIELVKPISLKDLIKKLNTKLNPDFNKSKIRIKSILVYYGSDYLTAEKKAADLGAGVILTNDNRIIKLKII